MQAQFKVIRVEPGVYAVGDDLIPDARPRHTRQIDLCFWIDAWPVAVSEFMRFVGEAGYSRVELWDNGRWALPRSIDERCHQVREASGSGPDVNRPAVGLNRIEAAAIAKSAGGRLPFESEWEIAATKTGSRTQLHDDLLEWTADVYSPVYWRADFRRRGVPWLASQSESLVSVRGFTSGALVKHISARRGFNPFTSLPSGGFRRVWDALPPQADEV